MTWRETLAKTPGSFRGAAFLCDAHDHEGGRRLARHEYPGRDAPYTEDLGRRGRTWSLELYVLGVNYMHKRDLLLAALEAEGAGELIHPYRGRLTVRVDSYRLRESADEGGLARFSVVFFDDDGAPLTLYPAVDADTSAAVGAAADAAVARAQVDFAGAFGVTSRPSYVAEAAEALVGPASALAAPSGGSVESFAGTLQGWQARVFKAPGQAYTAVGQIRAMATAAASLVRAPVNLATEVCGLLTDARDWVEQPPEAAGLYRDLSVFGTTLAEVLGTTPGRGRQRQNQAAFVKLVRDAAVIEGVRQTSLTAYATSTEALADRARWGEQLDARMEEASDALYAELARLRAALAADLAARGARLPELVTWRPAQSLPSLVVAHALYGPNDLEARAAEVAARNRARHPGFLSSPLSVLSA